MGRKPKGGKRGRKSDFNEEQTQFLEPYGARFHAGAGNGALYSEVSAEFIRNFGIASVNKPGQDPLTLREGEDIEAIEDVDDRKKVMEARAEARQWLRQVRQEEREPSVLHADKCRRNWEIGSGTVFAIAKLIRRASTKSCVRYWRYPKRDPGRQAS